MPAGARRRGAARSAIALVLALASTPLRAQSTAQVDVLVYGGNSAGVMAAYTARMAGRSVVLVEPGRHLGGLASGGLGYTDIGNKYAVTGLGLDFYRRVGRVYGQFEAWMFEPHVAEQVFQQYVDRARVNVLYSRRVTRVRKEGTRIRAVTLEDADPVRGAPAPPVEIEAKQFIDASYEGDLMARAGVRYAVGRESNATYGEQHNGVQLRDKHQFPDGVDPYLVKGKPESGLLPEISGTGVAPAGTGDTKVQAYNFRLAMCQGEHRISVARPARYDSARYELLLRLMEARPWSSLGAGFKIDRLVNGKTDWNNQGAFSTDYIGHSWDYPDASYARRAEIWRAHEEYQRGLLWFVGHDARVPQKIRDEMTSWGFCPDEFLDTGGWPHQLYVREARRMIGEYVMTQHNVVGDSVVTDGIGMGAYGMDSHNTERVVVNGMVKNEGDVQVGGFAPYPISYRAITPRRAEATNLLVPVALSASHLAYGSIRMEPVFMVLGQSAAVAAGLAIDSAVPVQRVNVAALQRELRENPHADGSLAEVLVDDAMRDRVMLTGEWSPARMTGAYGPSALRSGAGGGRARLFPRVRTAGRYAVYLYWPRVAGLAQRATVTVRHADGATDIQLDMRAPTAAAQGGLAQWNELGEFEFRPDRDAWVELAAEAGQGDAIVDALLLVPVRGD